MSVVGGQILQQPARVWGLAVGHVSACARVQFGPWMPSLIAACPQQRKPKRNVKSKHIATTKKKTPASNKHQNKKLPHACREGGSVNLLVLGDVDEALRQAKLVFLTEVDDMAAHPNLWASFVSIGDDSPIKVRKISFIEQYWFYGMLIVFAILGIVIFVWRINQLTLGRQNFK